MSEHNDKRILMQNDACAVMSAMEQVSSGRSLSEPAAPSGALAVGTGSLPVSSAEALCSRWEWLATSWKKTDAARSSIYTICAHELRREMERASVRQPEENNQGQPRPSNSGNLST